MKLKRNYILKNVCFLLNVLYIIKVNPRNMKYKKKKIIIFIFNKFIILFKNKAFWIGKFYFDSVCIKIVQKFYDFTKIINFLISQIYYWKRVSWNTIHYNLNIYKIQQSLYYNFLLRIERSPFFLQIFKIFVIAMKLFIYVCFILN